MQETIKRCKICVMPETVGKVILDEEGICNICRENEKVQLEQSSFFDKSQEEKEEIFTKKINQYRSQEKYDCAVGISGGKDSVMTLYIAKEKLKLNPLAIFIDNGFMLPEMYDNVKNATDLLNVDLVIFKNNDIKKIFKLFVESGNHIYFCRVCHLLIDLTVKDICKRYGINLILGGYTKGQNFVGQKELFSIFDESDENTLKVLESSGEFNYLIDFFKSPQAYFAKNYGSINSLSPFKYMDYDEDEIIDFISQNFKFKLPKKSWPEKSTNCSFNFVSQYLARKEFGYSQHETELSTLVRAGEESREDALKVLNTPIEDEDLSENLDKIQFNLVDFKKQVEGE